MDYFDIAIQKGVDFLVMINPMARASRSQSAHGVAVGGRAGSGLRRRGFMSIGELASRINFEARLSRALKLFQHDYPAKEVLVISSAQDDALLFERSFLSYRDRVQLLCSGYSAVVEMVRQHFGRIHAQCSNNEMSISLARLEQRFTQRLMQLTRTGATPCRITAPPSVKPGGRQRIESEHGGGPAARCRPIYLHYWLMPKLCCGEGLDVMERRSDV
jgi:hypothetical protein